MGHDLAALREAFQDFGLEGVYIYLSIYLSTYLPTSPTPTGSGVGGWILHF